MRGCQFQREGGGWDPLKVQKSLGGSSVEVSGVEVGEVGKGWSTQGLEGHGEGLGLYLRVN